jgi:hypothetical protein
MPYNGESVTISGADVVTGWSVYSGSIYKAPPTSWDLGSGNNQLFVDGQMMIEARWPNTSYADLSNPTWAISQNTGNNGSASFFADANMTQPDGFWNGGYVVNSWTLGWFATAIPIKTYTKGVVEFGGPGTFDASAGVTSRYWLTGTLAALDSNGEWFKDSSGIYLWTPNGDDPSDHTVEVKSRLYAFDLRGKANITIQDFNIFSSGILTNSDSSDNVIDGIFAKYISQFYNTEADDWRPKQDRGILLAGSGNILKNCHIAYSSGSGVVLQGTNQTVNNCVIHDVNYYASDSAAIYTNSGFGHQITYNTLYNSGRALIAHRKVPGMKILHNVMYNAMLQTQDGGATYTVGTDGGGTEIAYNLIHDVHAISQNQGFGVGIYLDDNSPNYIIHHNVIWNINANGRGMGIFLHLGGSSNEQVYNNTLWNVLDNLRNDCASGCKIYNNLSSTGINSTAGCCGTDLQNNLITSTSQFVDAANGNFQLGPGSLAIDFGRIVPGITDGYVGSAPDAGAYEYGAAPWSAGANGSVFAPLPPPSSPSLPAHPSSAK